MAQTQESKLYARAAGVLLAAMLTFGALSLFGVFR